MPTYEYACSQCNHHWEEVQKITAAPLEECPNCHQKTAHRQISGGSFILKGGGWYSDLYSSAPKKADKGDAKDSSSSESSGKSDTKSETKSETKSDTKTEKKESTAPPAPSTSTSSTGSGSKT